MKKYIRPVVVIRNVALQQMISMSATFDGDTDFQGAKEELDFSFDSGLGDFGFSESLEDWNTND